jgi:hypothetical protein
MEDLAAMDSYHFLDAVRHPDQIHDDSFKLDSLYPYRLSVEQRSERGTHLLVAWEFSGGEGAVKYWVGYQVDVYTFLPEGVQLVFRMSYDTIVGAQYWKSFAGGQFEALDQLYVEKNSGIFEKITAFFEELKTEKVHV